MSSRQVPDRPQEGLADPAEGLAAQLAEAEELIAQRRIDLAAARLTAAQETLADLDLPALHPLRRRLAQLRARLACVPRKEDAARSAAPRQGGGPAGTPPAMPTPAMRARRDPGPGREWGTVSGGLPTLGRHR
ncbi:hypothetical protein [Blastococcus sp. SYSU DS0539]